MGKNIRHCLAEKDRKVQHVRENYAEWWLALVDYIGFGLSSSDQELFRDQISITHTWDKVLLIDPRDHSRWFEL
jgi:hypothetical protein